MFYRQLVEHPAIGRDPDGTAWRRAVRAAVVVPGVFAVGVALGSDVVALYALFGAMSHLVFGDYGGPPGHRAAAYLTTTVAGLALICAGTAVSGNYVGAALATVVVGFGLTLAGVVGPAVAQLRTPLLLAFVLPASTSAPFGDVGPRLGGWLLAGVVSLIAAFVLLPRRNDLAVATSAAADACADVVRALERGGTAEKLDELTAARAVAAATAFVPTARRQALIMVIDELRTFGTLLPDSDAGRADASAHVTLRTSVQAALLGCASALRGEGLPDVEALDRARAEHRSDLEHWAHDSLVRGERADRVLDAMDGERNLRLLSHVALGIANAATTVCGASAPTQWRDLAPRGGSEGGTPAARRGWQAIRSHLTVSSVRFRDALRAGTAIGLAVFVAGIGNFSHGFWVALGTLAVLRTSVLAGERSAVAAVGGTAAGFLAAIPILWIIGSADAVTWVVLPLLVFVAAYASGALPFAVGQAAFTAFVVLAVDIIEPEGWRTGEIRLVDVITGAAVALVAGALFWPRGAQPHLRASLADLYRATATLLSSAFGVALGTAAAGAASAAERSDLTAFARAQASVADLVAERGRANAEVTSSVALVATAARLRAAGERIELLGRLSGAAPATLVADIDAVVGRFALVAEDLACRRSASEGPGIDVASRRRDATVKRLASEGRSDDAQTRADAFTLVWVGHWLVDLDQAADHLRAPVNALARRETPTADRPCP
jgi:uncharacterized membrane protein YccC